MASLKDAGLTQALLSDPFSLAYVTGDRFRPGERFLALLLREGKKPALFLNRLFSAPHVAPENIVLYDDTESGVCKVLPLIDHASPLGIDRKMAAGFLLELQEGGASSCYVNASPCVDHVRACKDAGEIALMERASQINDRAMLALCGRIRGGVTEIELAGELAGIYRELGADGFSFPPIVSFGANAADPHHSPDGTVLEPGQCVLFDIGCIKDGYCSDMTRTYYYKTVSAKDREIYELTRRANEAAEAAMKPGVRYCDLDGIARKIIADGGYGPYFTHRLGHSIGQQGHECGDVSSVNTEQVKPGNIFSCEPGIYLPGETGVRIEDLCLITETGVKILNRVSKELQIIG